MRDASAVDAPVIESARAALLETTSADTVGEVTGIDEPAEGVLDVHFATTMRGYPGWTWAVSVSVADGIGNPSVLELGLTPGEGALVAPEWTPWSERLADYRAAQEAKGPEGDLDEALADEEELLEEEDLLADDEDELDGVYFDETSIEDTSAAAPAGESDDEGDLDDDDDDEDEDEEDDDEDDEVDEDDEDLDDDGLDDDDELDEGDDQDDVDADDDRDAGDRRPGEPLERF